jgi:hypothetical protein
VVVVVAVIVVSASTIAHIPGPSPTTQAIASIEQNPRLQANAPPNGHYVYLYYSDDPGWDITCRMSSAISDGLHFLFPFHDYSTSTLVFQLQINNSISPVPQAIVEPLIDVQVNPPTGQILNISPQLLCA